MLQCPVTYPCPQLQHIACTHHISSYIKVYVSIHITYTPLYEPCVSDCMHYIPPSDVTLCQLRTLLLYLSHTPLFYISVNMT